MLLKVFVSSTSLDLKRERSRVERAIHGFKGTQFVGMEYFGSRTLGPVQVSLSTLDDCHVYVGVFGHRYGSLDPTNGRSVTENEYRRACELGIERLIYIAKRPAPRSRRHCREDDASVEKLAALKQELMGHTVTFFANADDLAACVVSDLHRVVMDWFSKELGVSLADIPSPGSVRFAPSPQLMTAPSRSIDHTPPARSEEAATQRPPSASPISAPAAASPTSTALSDQLTLAAGSDPALHARIDAVRQLIMEGRIRTAQERLRQLRIEAGAMHGQDAAIFRIAINLGACALEERDFDRAEQHFRDAEQLRPVDPKLRSNLALLFLMRGQASRALEQSSQAFAIAPRDPDAAVVHIQAVHAAGGPDHLEAFLAANAWMRDDPKCAAALGFIALGEGRFDEAQRFLTTAHEHMPSDFRLALALAESVLLSLQNHPAPDLPWRVPGDDRDALLRVEHLATHAIQLLDHSELSVPLHHALALRATVRRGLGRFDEAGRDADRVLAENPQDDRALLSKGLVLLQKGDLPAAARALEAIRAPLDAYVALPLAHTYLQMRLPHKAHAVLAPLWRPGDRNKQQLDIAELLLSSLWAQGKAAECDAILDSVVSAWDDDPEALSVRASHLRRQDRTSEALRLLQQGLKGATGGTREKLVLETANLLFAMREFGAASDLYGTIVPLGSDTPELRRYLVALYNAGQYGKAIETAQQVRGSADPIPVVSEVEAAVLEFVGDLPRARAIWASLADLFPTNPAYQIEAARLDMAQGNQQAATQTLETIKIDQIAGDPRGLMLVAQARTQLGLPDALPYAYLARRLAFGEPQLHLVYIGVFLAREDIDKPLLSSQTVTVDASVTLRHDEQQYTYTIVDKATAGANSTDLPSDTDLARLLLGRKQGEQVVLRQGDRGEERWEIVGVTSKYVAAFQESLAVYQTRFPGAPGLQRIRISNGNIAPFLAFLDENSEFTSGIIRANNEGLLPLCTVAQLLGRPVLDIWRGFTSSPTPGIKASLAEGTLQRQTAALRREQTVVADVTALAALSSLGLLDAFSHAFDTIAISHSTRAALEAGLHADRLRSRAIGHIGKHEGRYFFVPANPDDDAADRALAQQILDFISGSAKGLPVPLRSDMDRNQVERRRVVLGESAADSALLARDLGAVLYSDDAPLRNLCRTEYGIATTWSEPIASFLCQSGLITETDLHQAVAHLASLHYRYVKVSCNTLFWQMFESGDGLGGRTPILLAALSGQACTPRSAVTVASELIQKMWTSPLPRAPVLLAQDLTLEAIITGRHPESTLRALLARLSNRLVLVPGIFEEVRKQIRAWARLRNVSV